MKKVLLGFVFFFVFCSSSVYAAQDFETRKQEITTRWNALPSAYKGEVYLEKPVTKAPYGLGKVADGYLQEGLAMFNFVRFLADLPDDVTIASDLTDLAQHGAVLLAATGTLTHWPSKPADMDQAFFDTGYQSTTSSNLGQAYTSISEAVRDWMKDNHDQLNLTTAGHRRWILSPLLAHTAFGVAGDGYARYFAGQVFDSSRKGYQVPDFVAWPGQTAFPVEFMDGKAAWTIQLKDATYRLPDVNTVTVTLTRVSDGHIWTFSSAFNQYSATNRYFNVDSQGYGGWEAPHCIIFRPEGIANYAGEYRVSIDGLANKDGTPAVLDYAVTFFSLKSSTPDPDPDPDPTPNPDNSDNGGGGGCNNGWSLLVLIVLMTLALQKRRA